MTGDEDRRLVTRHSSPVTFIKNLMGALRWSLVALLLVAFFVRLMWFIPFPDIPPKFDQGAFLRESRVLLERGFAKWKYDERAPGYILFLAANLQWSGDAALAVIRVSQSLLSVATVAAVFALTRLLLGHHPRTQNSPRPVGEGSGVRSISPRPVGEGSGVRSISPRPVGEGLGVRWIALLAAGLAAFYPDYIFYSQLLWSETLFVFLTTLGLVLLLRGYRTRTDWRWFLASGVCFGSALLTREVLLAFVLLCIPLWLWLALDLKRRARVQLILVFGIGVASLLAPWTLRNVVQGNGLELISWQGGRDFWKYNARLLRAPLRNKAMMTVLRQEPNGAASNGRGYREGMALILRQPLQWLLAKTYNTAQSWRDVDSVALNAAWRLGFITRAAQKRLSPYLDAAGALWIIFTVIGFVYYRDARVKLLFGLFVLASLLAFFAIHYIARFRLGLAAPLFPLTAYGIAASVGGARAFLQTRRIADRRRLALTLCLLFLLGAAWLPIR
ncbi:MAG: phospholipid carrier-dependent glycosyltransferase [Chloroflexi bacterium]|nr:phospholipid carrier-dependent glycosyltransferase [Chloroflexota bacterium]